MPKLPDTSTDFSKKVGSALNDVYSRKPTTKYMPLKDLPPNTRDLHCDVEAKTNYIIIDENSVRHWLAFCFTGNPDSKKWTNDMVRKFASQESLDQMFAPLKFMGWARDIGNRKKDEWKMILSPLKKYYSIFYYFELPGKVDPKRKIGWLLEDIKKYCKKPSIKSKPITNVE